MNRNEISAKQLNADVTQSNQQKKILRPKSVLYKMGAKFGLSPFVFVGCEKEYDQRAAESMPPTGIC